jgi:hypothetical protein
MCTVNNIIEAIESKMVFGEAELKMKKYDRTLFVKKYAEDYSLYDGCELVVGDVSLNYIAQLILDGKCYREDIEPLKENKVSKKQYKNEKLEEVKNLLNSNDEFLYKALKVLYNNQTEDEQNSKETKEYNGIGFNGLDAPIMSSFAEFLNKRGFLSKKQKAIARKKMAKYAKQVMSAVNF